MPNQNNVIPYQYNIKFFRIFLRNRHPRKLHNLYLCFTKKARTHSTSIELYWRSFEFSPFLACVASVSVRFRSKERGKRVKDRAKNGAKERGGGGEETFIFWLLFDFSRGQNRESRSPVFLCSETKRKLLLRRLALCRSQKFDNLLSALRHFR